jgi:peptidoglycan/LPS O-acetylase OafA/YrhL
MNDKNLRTVEISALSISIIVTALATLGVTMWEINLGTFLFILWGISPYVCLFLAGVLLRKIAPNLKMSLVFCATSLLMLGFTLLLSVGRLVDKSLMDPFVFLFFPIYLNIAGAVLIGGGLIWALLSKFSRNTSI